MVIFLFLVKSHVYPANVNSTVDRKNPAFLGTFFIAPTLQLADSNMEATGDLYDNFTLSMSDITPGREFRAFLNNPVGRAYFDNHIEEQGHNMQEMS